MRVSTARVNLLPKGFSEGEVDVDVEGWLEVEDRVLSSLGPPRLLLLSPAPPLNSNAAAPPPTPAPATLCLLLLLLPLLPFLTSSHPCTHSLVPTSSTPQRSFTSTSKHPLSTSSACFPTTIPSGNSHSPRTIFICKRGSNASWKGNVPDVRRKKRSTPRDQMS